MHDEAIRVDGRRSRWRGAPFVQRGRAAAQGTGTLGCTVPQPPARGQYATSRGRRSSAPVACWPRAPVTIADVHSARTGRQQQPETGTAAIVTTAFADNYNRDRGRNGACCHVGVDCTIATADLVRVQQLR